MDPLEKITEKHRQQAEEQARLLEESMQKKNENRADISRVILDTMTKEYLTFKEFSQHIEAISNDILSTKQDFTQANSVIEQEILDLNDSLKVFATAKNQQESIKTITDSLISIRKDFGLELSNAKKEFQKLIPSVKDGKQGPKGDKGDKGDSIKGKDGRDGKDGKDGINGKDGKDGRVVYDGGHAGAMETPIKNASTGVFFPKDASGAWLINPSSGPTLSLQTNGVANGSQSLLNLAQGSGITVTDNGTGTVTIASTDAGGTVTSVSVVTANGLAGTVDTATTTPAITLSTTVTGVLKGNGTAISAAVAGTDYQSPISLTTTGTSGAATFIANTLNIPQYQAAGSYVTSVSGTTNRITSTGGTTPVIDIAATYVGQTSITTLGTITTGVWNGTAITNANLANSTITIGSTSIALGASSTTLAGLTSVTSTSFVGALTGNATTATALATGRTISITGDLAYTSPSFDGSGNVTAAGTLNTVNSNVGSFGSATQTGTFTVNAKGLTTAAANVTITPAVTSITGLATGMATFLATPSSANLAATVTDETGSGLLVFATGPTISLGSASTAVTQTPGDNSTKIATTAYADNAAQSVGGKEAAKYATTAALPSIIYANGSSGVGATLTGVALAALSVDGASPIVGDRILVKNQASTFQNGIYTVTATGSGIAVFVLTRTTDFDQSTDIKTGQAVFVTAGSTLASTTWDVNSADNPVMGTDPITFVQSAGPGSFVAGNGIAITGNSIAIDTAITVDKNTAQALTNKDLTSLTNTFPTLNQNTTGSAAKLTTARTIGITGDLTYTSPAFDGSANVTAAGILATVNSNVGTFGSASQVAQVTVNGKGLVTAAANVTITASGIGAVPTTRLINTTSPLTGGGDLSADRTIAINDAAADGTTKGAATFKAADFDSSAGLISIDYTNGQKATASVPGFLTAADWSTFNSKASRAFAFFVS